MKETRSILLLSVALILLVLSFLLNISLGSVSITSGEILNGIFTGEWAKASREQIILNYRLPKALVAILAGIGLSISGLQMQTFFRNPLAGPFVLGISSGAGLGVAILMLAGSAFGLVAFGGAINPWAIAIAGTVGASLVLITVSLVAWKVRDSMTLLIVGLMFGSAVSAVISVLSYFSGAEDLKLFTIWSMGSLGGLVWDQVWVLILVIILGVIPVIASVKSYNGMLLGESYAKSMGINPDRLRWLMILSTGLLAGCITAFCGPIAFIGIAVPHVARMIWRTSDHRVLFPATAILGAILLLLCDVVAQMPGSAQTLPINAVTSLVGAPIVISLVLRKNFSKEF
ncbi:iron complex transport system permease protein [Algoriphagus ratkowskyi]|uniref:Iron ABC transporter permease n=1 Tax=Algoriphagus ratkowskyi TaxID=57028 RepID=A0A2W7RI58_9BACT|nr:iron ABC transporter permease [Algoriphagus ratkowskyi]PZX50455.1 iron complex transport system permease protein [Algoriphagus ratkowskyi]TXD75733.1 iron ABC transporter permease [Algoriphagus ratkowskyi]